MAAFLPGYGRFRNLLLPKITSIQSNAALYPTKKRVVAGATIKIVNRNEKPIIQTLLGAWQLLTSFLTHIFTGL